MNTTSTSRNNEGLPGSFGPAAARHRISLSRTDSRCRSAAGCHSHKNAAMATRCNNAQARMAHFTGLPNDGLVHGALCDACDVRIVGTRFKCRDCADFDFCRSCVMHHTDIHTPGHTFKAIHYPKRHKPVAPSNAFVTTLVCDGCDTRIQGPSYKCLHCPDFDLCCMCEHYLEALHDSNHIFAKLRKRCKPVGTRAPLLPLDLYDNDVAAVIRSAPCEACEIANQTKCRLHGHEQPPPYKEVEKPAVARELCPNCAIAAEPEKLVHAPAATAVNTVDLLTGSADLIQESIAQVQPETTPEPETPAHQSVKTQTPGQVEEAPKEMVDVGIQPEAERNAPPKTDVEDAPVEEVVREDVTEDAKIDTVEKLVDDIQENLHLNSTDKLAKQAPEAVKEEKVPRNDETKPVAEEPTSQPTEVPSPGPTEAQSAPAPEEVKELKGSDSGEVLEGVVCTESEMEDNLSETESSSSQNVTTAAESEEDGFEIVDMDRL